jgi:hypothetical protein
MLLASYFIIPSETEPFARYGMYVRQDAAVHWGLTKN